MTLLYKFIRFHFTVKGNIKMNLKINILWKYGQDLNGSRPGSVALGDVLSVWSEAGILFTKRRILLSP